MNRVTTEVVIVGAGPAGLSCAAAINQHISDYLLVDEGALLSDRVHNRKHDIAKGIGGAGLFSDGKFSFFPSGSNVYDLRWGYIEIAYEWFTSTMGSIGLGIPSLISRKVTTDQDAFSNGKKKYCSFHVSLNKRKILTEKLSTACGGRILASTKVLGICKNDHGYMIHCKQTEGHCIYIQTRSIVVSTGRCGSIGALADSIAEMNHSFSARRFEFGVRIETNPRASFFHKNPEADVKYIWRNNYGIEYRTFCTCRNGEIWNIPCGDVFALSGRADGIKSNYSNFGFLVRYEGEHFSRGLDVWHRILSEAGRSSSRTFVESLSSYLKINANESKKQIHRSSWFPERDFFFSPLRHVLGEYLYIDLRDGLRRLVNEFPDLIEYETYCLFPAIEGVGYYPSLSNELQLDGEQIWFAGDAVGSFRGLVPAFISGYVAGLSITSKYHNEVIPCHLGNTDGLEPVTTSFPIKSDDNGI